MSRPMPVTNTATGRYSRKLQDMVEDDLVDEESATAA